MNFRDFHSFSDPDLLTVALTHKSRAFEERSGNGSTGLKEHNEKLEFLGDAVIGLVLADLLMVKFGTEAEGGLSKKRAALVNEEKLAELARQIGLDQALQLGKGEQKTGGGSKPRILACAFEAWIGAVFRDSGFEVASKVVSEVFKEQIELLSYAEVDFAADFKTRLQERTQTLLSVQPQYRLVDESGPAHERLFAVEVMVSRAAHKIDALIAKGWGRSKKAAEQAAAQIALKELEDWSEGLATESTRTEVSTLTHKESEPL